MEEKGKLHRSNSDEIDMVRMQKAFEDPDS